MELKQTTAQEKETGITFKILLVDDRTENLLTLEHIIENENRVIVKATSGNEALKIVLGDNIDLILLDVQMPGMDGYEAAELLRMNPKTKHIPIIFVSAVSRGETKPMEKFETGTVDFLFKPLDIAETKSKVALFESIHKLNTENKNYNSRFEQMTKEMDHFIYVVSHDVKAPLRAIENLATWIEEDLGASTNKNVQENLALLKNRVARMQHLLDGITEFSRVGRINESKTQVNTNQLVQEVISSLSPPEGFAFTVQENLPSIICEKTKLQKVFLHLIQNSIIHHHNQTGKIFVSVADEGNVYQFTVSDDGQGIKPQHCEKVFEIFHTLVSKDKHETAGVGLSIVKKIVESTGNRVWIDTQVAEGTTVHFTWNK